MAGSSSDSLKKTLVQDPEHTSFSCSMPTKPSKSKFFPANFCSKAVIIILVLVIFLLFPSQAPEFTNKNAIITKLWELFYLLVIGIAVSYGLFSRKTNSIHSTDEIVHLDKHDNKIGGKETYFSGISNISAIFEDGLGDSYGFDEKRVFEECKSSRFSKIESRFGNSEGEKLSQHFIGESMVIIDDENYVLEQLRKPKSSRKNMPLGLPVRSLKSKNLDPATVESSNGGGSNSGFKDSSNGGDKWKNGKFRGLVPIRLEEKFNQAVSPSPVPWRSKSMRMEKREDIDIDTVVKSPSHFRPLSVGVFEFEGPKSQSMRFSVPSQASPSELPSFDSGSSELTNKKTEELEFKEANPGYPQPCLRDKASLNKSKTRRYSLGTSSEISAPPSSKEIMKPSSKSEVQDVLWREKSALDSNSDASFIKSKHQLFSIGTPPEMFAHSISKDNVKDFDETKLEDVLGREKGSLHLNDDASFVKSKHQQFKIGTSTSTDMNANVSSKENVKHFGKSTKGDLLRKEKKVLDSSNSSQQPAPHMNAYKAGKSVRTIRPKERAAETKENARVKVFPSHTDEKFDMEFGKGETLENKHTKNARNGNIGNTNLDGDQQICEDFSDAEPHSGEVDRKAEEFIAKFREQIRLQRCASARRLKFW